MEEDKLTKRQTLEQKRAKYAWNKVPENPTDDYKTTVDGAPALIQSSGLGQAMAFYSAKKQNDYVDHVAEWVLQDEPDEYYYKDKRGLIKKITDCDSREYRKLTEEAMAITGWLKRFTSAKQNS